MHYVNFQLGNYFHYSELWISSLRQWNCSNSFLQLVLNKNNIQHASSSPFSNCSQHQDLLQISVSSIKSLRILEFQCRILLRHRDWKCFEANSGNSQDFVVRQIIQRPPWLHQRGFDAGVFKKGKHAGIVVTLFITTVAQLWNAKT